MCGVHVHTTKYTFVYCLKIKVVYMYVHEHANRKDKSYIKEAGTRVTENRPRFLVPVMW